MASITEHINGIIIILFINSFLLFQVLRFFGYWDDQETEHGYLHKLEIHYFLSDDTIEIKEKVAENSGRDSGFMFLRRGKLPKTCKGLAGPGDTAPYTLLNVLGKECLSNFSLL